VKIEGMNISGYIDFYVWKADQGKKYSTTTIFSLNSSTQCFGLHFSYQEANKYLLTFSPPVSRMEYSKALGGKVYDSEMGTKKLNFLYM
jgi:hypothetical protein